jgi:type I restriction enzyme M protein
LSYLNPRPANDWEFLALARHHGVPTRLLDWTENPLAALFFAIEEPTNSDSAVWSYSYVEQEEALDVQKDPNPMHVTRVRMYRPAHIHSRISTQASVFTVHPENFKELKNPWGLPMHKVTVHNVSRPRLRVELQRLAVHRATLFADLDGIGKYICDKWRND